MTGDASGCALSAPEWDRGEACLISRDDEQGWRASRRDEIGGLITAGAESAALGDPRQLRPAPRRPRGTKDEGVVNVYTWNADADGRQALGVCTSHRKARRTVAAWMRNNQAHRAVVEQRCLVTGAGLGTSYSPADRRWTARLRKGGRVTWTEQPAREVAV
jgi:hypothetical protein